MTLDDHVDVVVGKQPDRLGRADQIRIADDALAQLDLSAGAHQREELPQIATARDVGKLGHEGGANQRRIIGPANLGDVALAGRIEHCLGVLDIELDPRLLQRAVPVSDQRAEKEHEKGETDQQRPEPCGTKNLLVTITARDAGADTLLEIASLPVIHTARDSA